jgi:hypothetical protein
MHTHDLTFSIHITLFAFWNLCLFDMCEKLKAYNIIIFKVLYNMYA